MPIIVKPLEKVPYSKSLRDMQAHVRQPVFSNEIWMVEHPPVYTIGRAGDTSHHLRQNHIPLVHTDRGGQITYHGPGQLVAYTLIETQKFNMQPLELVTRLENATIDFLASLNITAYSDPNRRGVYTQKQKIASIGLKMHQGRSYHGIALNINTDLKAFDDINPCGYNDLQMTNTSNYHPISITVASTIWSRHMIKHIESKIHE